MPDLKLYRVALLVAIVLAAGSLLALRPPQSVTLSTQPVAFDAQIAASDMQTLVADFPGRVAGSPSDRLAGRWVAHQFTDSGLTPHTDTFSATLAGRTATLTNVWAVSPGTAQGAIVVLAPRDSPPLATQGANDDASGTAALVELATVFSGAAHDHPIVFVSTDGDTGGALGAREFLDRHSDLPILTVVALRQVAGRDVHAFTLNGWATRPLIAPPWLWSLGRAAGRAGGELATPLPPVTSQILRLAIPGGGGSQAPFVAAGIAAIELSAPGPSRPAVADTLDTVSTDTLARSGRAGELLVTSLDGAPQPLAGSGQTVFFSRFRQLSGGFVVWILVVLSLPLALVAVDLVRRAVKRRLPLTHSLVRLALRTAPWLLTLLLVYLANLLSLLPGHLGGVVSPDAVVSHAPRYLRVVMILLFLAVAYHYAMAIERRLARRYPADTEAVVAVALLALLACALVMLAVNPFSLALILPAALLWPLARSGSWVRSRLVVWGGLAVVAASLVYLGERLHLGWGVWWYFFLLLETRAIPVMAVVVAIVVVAAAALLGHELHGPPRVARHPARRRAAPRRHRERAATGLRRTMTVDANATGGPPFGGPPVRGGGLRRTPEDQ
ncbi:MAG TPA: M28 family peptidase [Thermoleophilia bacterium]|nr:M28 family peptidase [Thermoleophilia bacterium]